MDYFLYTDKVLTAANHFVLYTPEMCAKNLAAHGLLADDSLASDHLLSCVDFRSMAPRPGDFDGNGVVDLGDYLAFVNCFCGPDTLPGLPPTTSVDSCLTVFDSDDDRDVDLEDVAVLAAVFGSP